MRRTKKDKRKTLKQRELHINERDEKGMDLNLNVINLNEIDLILCKIVDLQEASLGNIDLKELMQQ